MRTDRQKQKEITERRSDSATHDSRSGNRRGTKECPNPVRAIRGEKASRKPIRRQWGKNRVGDIYMCICMHEKEILRKNPRKGVFAERRRGGEAEEDCVS